MNLDSIRRLSNDHQGDDPCAVTLTKPQYEALLRELRLPPYARVAYVYGVRIEVVEAA